MRLPAMRARGDGLRWLLKVACRSARPAQARWRHRDAARTRNPRSKGRARDSGDAKKIRIQIRIQLGIVFCLNSVTT
jgi:hypothetical protein